MSLRFALRDPRVLIFIVVAALLTSAGLVVVPSSGRVQNSSIPSHFTVGGKTFSFTYVATNTSAREEGLMNRKITGTTTMLFVFPKPGIYSFWMYHTNSSLDIIWVSASGNLGTVVYLVTGAQSCFLAVGCPSYTPTAAANYVIEASAGFAASNNVNPGTTIQFS